MPITWEGKPGLTETGVVAEGEMAGKTVVRVNAKYFRPAEVRSASPIYLLGLRPNPPEECVAPDSAL